MEIEEKEQILKNEAERLLNIPGKTRGENYLTAIFVKKRYGKEAVERLEKKLSELFGREYKFPKGRPKKWYLEGEDVLILVTAKHLFDWTDGDVFEVGKFHAVHSFTMRVAMRYFLNPKNIFEIAPRIWAKHFDFSELEGVKFDEKEKIMILRIKDYRIHPIMTQFYAGYFYAVSRCSISSKNIKVEIAKSVYKGDPYEEFKITW